MAKLATLRPPTPGREKKELTRGEVSSAVKTSLATANLDGRIAWAILEGLKGATLAGPWEVGGDWWQRHTHDGKLVAIVHKDATGAGAKGRLGRRSGVQSFPTVAVAMFELDSQLQQLGWTLVPPFGGLP